MFDALFWEAAKTVFLSQEKPLSKPAPVDENWMRVAPGTDAAIWRPWSRETGEL